MDSLVGDTCGQQEGSAYKGDIGCPDVHRDCHALFIFNQDDDLARAVLRNGNVHAADDWRSMLESVVKRYSSEDVPTFLKADAA